MPPEVREQLLEIVKSFGSFLNNMLQWNFGVQLNPSRSPILPELSWRIRNTLILIGFSTAASILAGTLVAIIASIRKPNRRRPLTFAHSLKCFLFGLTPFIALILVYIFSFQLRLLPRSGMFSLPPPTPGSAGWYMDVLAHLFLPVLTITLVNAIRSAMIIWSGSFSLDPRSPLKISLLSITTFDFTLMVSAVIFVESIFAFPGVGQWFLSSLYENNHPVVIGSFVALLAITVGLGSVSTLLDLLQVGTGIREDLEKPSSQRSEIKKQSHKRPKATNRLTDYFRRKSLVIGSIMVSFFVVLAIVAPFSTPYLPASQLYSAPRLATGYAVPAWFTVFPQFSNLNPTVTITPDLSEATLWDQSGPLQVNLDTLNISFTPTGKGLQKASATLDLGNFSYMHSTPPPFTMHASYTMHFNRTGAKVYFIIKNYTARPTWEEYFKNPTKAEMLIGTFSPPPIIPSIDGINQTTLNLKVDSYTYYVVNSLYDLATLTGPPPDPAKIIFSEKDVYGIQVKFEFSNVYPFKGAHAELYIGEVDLTIWGRVYGILGTDFRGNDVWTELIYGARTITVMSFGLAALAVVLGLPFGILAGRFKGWTDNIVIVTAETFLSIPIVPILLICARYLQPSMLPTLFWVLPSITIIAFRNVYLTTPANNESTRSKALDLLKYSLANFFLTAISVPLILISIDFLGFGDPNQPSWGRMLYHAYQLGGLEAWWTWMVPIGCILLFITGLFLIGSSLDEA